MPRLMRGIARTAVVAGTATAVSNGVSRRQYNKWEEKDAQQAQQQQAQQAQQQPAAAPPASSETNTIEQLKQLGELHQQGVLTDEEFAAQKAKLLG